MYSYRCKFHLIRALIGLRIYTCALCIIGRQTCLRSYLLTYLVTKVSLMSIDCFESSQSSRFSTWIGNKQKLLTSLCQIASNGFGVTHLRPTHTQAQRNNEGLGHTHRRARPMNAYLQLVPLHALLRRLSQPGASNGVSAELDNLFSTIIGIPINTIIIWRAIVFPVRRSSWR